jgi:hypothetical protein
VLSKIAGKAMVAQNGRWTLVAALSLNRASPAAIFVSVGALVSGPVGPM